MRQIVRAGPPLFLALFSLAAWQWLVTSTHQPAWLLPSPTEIWSTLWQQLSLIWPNAVVTFGETGVGFAVSLVLGVGLALAFRFVGAARALLYPWVIVSQTVPIVAIAPVLVVWFGYGLLPKVIVVVLLCFFPIVVNTYDGLQRADREASHLLRTLGASERRAFWLAEFPFALPYLFSGVRVAITFSLIAAMMAEWVGSSAGLGYLMIRATSQFETPLIFAAVAVLSLAGLLAFSLVTLLEHWLLPWHRLSTFSATIGGSRKS